jgi:RNA polymerase sigma-70 factor, ECF subfamily
MSPVSPSDSAAVTEAIRRVQAGDVEAYAVVVVAHQRALRAWVARWCAAGIDPDDIAQRAFVAGYRSLARFTEGAILPWLCTIARRELLAELKLRRRDPARPVGSLAELAELEWAAAEHDLPSAELDERRARVLRTCLEQVSGDAAEVLDRRYRRGQPIAEIAAALGASLDSIKARLHWLRGKLHDCVSTRLAKEDR